MRIFDCKVNHLTNPLGFQMDDTRFSWKVAESNGKCQREARILVARDPQMNEILADTGFCADLDSLCAPVSVALIPCTRYYWTVAVRSDADEEAVSGVNWFETAKMDQPWAAKWIGCPDGPRHPIYSKDFAPAGDVVSARLYICGLGLYEAHMNGRRIGREVLTPYCNAYDKWVQYQTFDVTEEIRAGGTLSVALGNGWYKGRFGFHKPDRPGGYYGDSWKLLAEVRIVRRDGTVTRVGTDESWSLTYGSITFSGIYDGEHRDDTLAPTPPLPARPAEPPQGLLTARYSLPVYNQREMPARKLIVTPAGETVLDLEQEITGGFRLRVNEPRGTLIHLQFGEVLQNDCFYRDNLRSAKAEYFYVSGGDPIELEPAFTFYGYRYVKIEGIRNLRAGDFTGLCQWSDMERTGALVTGAPKVNRLIANTEWGQLDNFLDLPTDCPQRDERMGWTGDAQVFAPTACIQRDCYAFYRKYLHDMALEQRGNDGAVMNVIPAFGMRSSACAWGDAAAIIPWQLYLAYGDKKILEEQFESMRAWVDWITRREQDNHGWRDQYHFGDWLALDNWNADSCSGGTDTGFLALVFYLESAELTAKAAEVIGRPEEAAKYRALAAGIRAGISEEYYSPAGRCCIDTQTAHILTLRHRLGPAPERSGPALIANLKNNGGKLRTGFIGTSLLCEALSQLGESGMAYDILLNEEYPGWLYAVNLGATTIWERWNSLLPDGSISSTGMNSLNHYSFGAVVRWIYERAAGLRRDEAVPGFRHAYFAPESDMRITSAHASCNSAAGIWEGGWQVENGRMTVRLTVPFGCRATVTLPGVKVEKMEVNAGNYVWVCPISE